MQEARAAPAPGPPVPCRRSGAPSGRCGVTRGGAGPAAAADCGRWWAARPGCRPPCRRRGVCAPARGRSARGSAACVLWLLLAGPPGPGVPWVDTARHAVVRTAACAPSPRWRGTPAGARGPATCYYATVGTRRGDAAPRRRRRRLLALVRADAHLDAGRGRALLQLTTGTLGLPRLAQGGARRWSPACAATARRPPARRRARRRAAGRCAAGRGGARLARHRRGPCAVADAAGPGAVAALALRPGRRAPARGACWATWPPGTRLAAGPRGFAAGRGPGLPGCRRAAGLSLVGLARPARRGRRGGGARGGRGGARAVAALAGACAAAGRTPARGGRAAAASLLPAPSTGCGSGPGAAGPRRHPARGAAAAARVPPRRSCSWRPRCATRPAAAPGGVRGGWPRSRRSWPCAPAAAATTTGCGKAAGRSATSSHTPRRSRRAGGRTVARCSPSGCPYPVALLRPHGDGGAYVRVRAAAALHSLAFGARGGGRRRRRRAAARRHGRGAGRRRRGLARGRPPVGGGPARGPAGPRRACALRVAAARARGRRPVRAQGGRGPRARVGVARWRGGARRRRHDAHETRARAHARAHDAADGGGAAARAAGPGRAAAAAAGGGGRPGCRRSRERGVWAGGRGPERDNVARAAAAGGRARSAPRPPGSRRRGRGPAAGPGTAGPAPVTWPTPGAEIFFFLALA